ncbi:MAG: hypothetical protein E7377_03960 [Clostridiales bacterium]|nr:hypothetical protein [Clostridiales bacterium]
MPKKKAKKWRRFRHRVITKLAYCVLYPYMRCKYHVRIERFKEQGKRQYFILFNHQTGIDQFIVGCSFKGPLYYVASEDIFSNGFISRLLQWAVAPIPIKKQATDSRAVLNCLRVRKEGGSIAVAPEGNRTYSGKTEYIKPAIVALCRALKLPLLLYRIEGGYGVQPRWSDVVRKGKMRAYVAKVVEVEEYQKLSDDELFALIAETLYVNEGVADAEFKSKRLAEYIERAIYVCPDCGLAKFESDKDLVTCTKCGRTVRYLPTKELQGVGKEFPFRFMTEWYDYQSDFINSLDVAAYGENSLFTDTVSISEVILYDKKHPLEDNVALSLTGKGINVKGKETALDFPFEEISAVTVLGKNKLNVYYGGKVYQMKGDQRFNALKYVQIYHRDKNVRKGEEDGKFLGL